MKIIYLLFYVFLLTIFASCSPLTTLDSCKNKVGVDKERCIRAVMERQNSVERRSELFGRR